MRSAPEVVTVVAGGGGGSGGGGAVDAGGGAPVTASWKSFLTSLGTLPEMLAGPFQRERVPLTLSVPLPRNLQPPEDAGGVERARARQVTR